MAQMKEQIKTLGKELTEDEIDNLSEARMLTELVDYDHKIEEKVKAMKNEIKKNIQGTKSEGKETRTPINYLEWKEEINIQLEKNEGTRIQKNEESLRNIWDNLKHSNIQIIGVPEGEQEEQQIENLFEKIMKENFTNLVKEIDSQEVQEAQRVPKKLDLRRNTPRHIVIKLPKIKDKQRILKAAREKETVTYKGVSIRLSDDFSKETL